MPLNNIEDIVADIRAGKMVVLMDDEDRENEGDLIMAATHVRAEDINFMARYGRGLICLTLTRERCAQLRLPLMVSGTTTEHRTNFTVSIEAAHGVTTGISAADRARTVRAAVTADARPADLTQPGHIFPLMAQPGGVLTRAGHTEAGCDLARLAGLEPAAVIVEILNEDGSMARRPDLEVFAQHHGLRIGTIADLIHYRIQREKTVEHISHCPVRTEYGEFQLHTYRDAIDNQLHLALVRGELHAAAPTLVRVHVENALDSIALKRDDSGWTLHTAMQRVAQEGTGVIVILRKPDTTQELLAFISHAQPHAQGSHPSAAEGAADLRTYGVGAQILMDLGVRKMRVLGQPRRLHGLSGFDLEIVDYVTTDKREQR